jgi:NADH-quinone oxidoreductase subunit N
VPLHFYAPDVYQGTNHANAGMLATLPKIAGLLVLVRIVYASMPGLETLEWKVALVIAVATMTLGNLVALWQTDIRRLLAYSSIAHGGYILIGIAAGLAHAETYDGGDMLGFQLHGVGAAFFYIAMYCLATIGAFAALKYLGGREKQVDGIDELAGLGRTRPLPAMALAVSMFSLAGVPPLAGFWGKLTLFGSALGVEEPSLRPWFLGLAVVGVVNAAIAMAFYLRVVGVMYFRPCETSGPDTVKAEGGAGAWWAMVACTILVLAIGVCPGPIIRLTDRAAHALRQAQPIDEDATNAALPGHLSMRQ